MSEDSNENREQEERSPEEPATGAARLGADPPEPGEAIGGGLGAANPSGDVSDLEESAGETIASASSLEHTSDALYIVREANYLLELEEELQEAEIELKEEVE